MMLAGKLSRALCTLRLLLAYVTLTVVSTFLVVGGLELDLLSLSLYVADYYSYVSS
jgi:hypothetical protein